jgi:anti-sigma factor RsiW
MTCQQFEKLIDSYISDELLIETNHDVLNHLENCVDCRNELSACREQRNQLAAAIMNSPELRIDPVFSARLGEELRHKALAASPWERIMAFKLPLIAAAVASLILVLAGSMLFVFNKRPDKNYPLTASVMTETVKLAVGDHENCAIRFALKEKPIPLKVAAKEYGSFYDGLDKTVTDAIKSGDYKFIEAHSCEYEGQRFAHIVLKHGDKVVSILIARTDVLDRNPATALGQFDGYQAASYGGIGFALFVISDLPEQDNLKLASDLSPAIAGHMASA